MILFLQLLMAHLLGDFLLQPEHWVRQKEQLKFRSPKLYLHVCIHFGLIMLLTFRVEYLSMALFIAASHLLIDITKLQLQTTRTKKRWFVADQFLHLAVLISVVVYTQPLYWPFESQDAQRTLLLATGTIFLTTPASVIIKMVLSQWAPATEIKSDRIETRSLQHAGMMIGYLERLLVFIFIIQGQWAAIGFLVTAKSVFRFSDLKLGQDRKLTEYILIGTLLSFGLAILTGILIQWLGTQLLFV